MRIHTIKHFAGLTCIAAGLLFSTSAHAEYYTSFGPTEGTRCGGWEVFGNKVNRKWEHGAFYDEWIKFHAAFSRKSCDYQAHPGVLKYSQVRYTFSHKPGNTSISDGQLVFNITDTVPHPGGPFVDKTINKTINYSPSALPADTLVYIVTDLYNVGTQKWEVVDESVRSWTSNP